MKQGMSTNAKPFIYFSFCIKDYAGKKSDHWIQSQVFAAAVGSFVCWEVHRVENLLILPAECTYLRPHKFVSQTSLWCFLKGIPSLCKKAFFEAWVDGADSFVNCAPKPHQIWGLIISKVYSWIELPGTFRSTYVDQCFSRTVSYHCKVRGGI